MEYKIYKITNLINGKIYVGQTKRKLKLRFYEHCRIKKTKRSNSYIGKAIKKYGKENFKIELMKVCKTQKEVDMYEMMFVLFAKHNMYGCYNINIGGNVTGRPKGFHLTEEHKRKISNSVLLAMTEETRLKLSISQKRRFEIERNKVK